MDPMREDSGSGILLRVVSGCRIDEVDGRRRTSPVFCRPSSAKWPLGSWIREQERTRSSDPIPTDGGNPLSVRERACRLHNPNHVVGELVVRNLILGHVAGYALFGAH